MPTNPGRSAVEKSSRERSTRLAQSVAKLLRSEATAKAAVSSSAVDELHVFVQDLENVSRIAETKDDAALGLYHNIKSIKSPLDIMQYIVDGTQQAAREDVVLLKDAKDLENHLARPFDLPLLHRTTDAQPSLVGARFSLEDLMSLLKRSPQDEINVYNYSITKPAARTKKVNVSNLLDSFPSSPSSPALNFLDIENRTSLQFCPREVRLSDVSLDRGGPDVGKTASDWVGQPTSEFFIASTKHAVSTIHVDTGGVNTWVAVLSGVKTWYYPRFANEQSVLSLAAAGATNPRHYANGWVKIELRVGDLLIMPPGLPHAVCTPEDCLLVGGQFYTAGNLGRTLRMLRIQEQHLGISNEDLYDSVYERLARTLLSLCNDAQMRPEDKLSICADAKAFEQPAAGIAPGVVSRLTVANIKEQLTQWGVQFNAGAKKAELTTLLVRAIGADNSDVGATMAQSARDGFLVAVHRAAKKFMGDFEEEKEEEEKE